MIKIEAGGLLNELKSYQADEFTGAVYLKTDKTLEIEQQLLTLSFHKGRITFADKKLPTADKLTQLIKKKLNLPSIEAALKAASHRVKDQNSIREPLAMMGRFGFLNWVDFEAAMLDRTVYHLEQVLPLAGVLSKESPIAFDLSYGTNGHGFKWKELQQELDLRTKMWAACTPSISSMYAVPVKGTNSQAITSEPLQKHIEQWMDGRRSLVDIANNIGQDPLKLAQQYLPWIQKGYIAFQPRLEGNIPLMNEVEFKERLAHERKNKPIILSVDDSLIVQTMIKRAISDHYQVLLANDAVSALNLLNTNKVDLLLLDVTMPDIDGLDLCRTIRSISKFRDLPVVMLTAKEGLIDKIKSQFAGSTHYLTKPIDRDKLLHIIDKYVEQRHPVSFAKS
jgi:CheY-like chemotaxis protein